MLDEQNILNYLEQTYSQDDALSIYNRIYVIVKLTFSYLTNIVIIVSYTCIYVKFRILFNRSELLAKVHSRYESLARIQKKNK